MSNYASLLTQNNSENEVTLVPIRSYSNRLKARLLWRLSVRSSSVNNVAACNPPPPICSERNDVTSKTETEPENRFWPFQKPKKTVLQKEPGFGNPKWQVSHWLHKVECARITKTHAKLNRVDLKTAEYFSHVSLTFHIRWLICY